MLLVLLPSNQFVENVAEEFSAGFAAEEKDRSISSHIMQLAA